MTTATDQLVDAERLSAAYHRCYETFEHEEGLFTEDCFFDLLPPLWRLQVEGPETFVSQLRAVAGGADTEVRVIRTIPTATGFVTEHEETQHRPSGLEIARRIHVCEVRDDRIAAVTVYCNGGWDDELRARHAAEAPMIRS